MKELIMRHLLPLALMLSTMLMPLAVEAGNLTVLSAVKKDKTINQANVVWQRNGESSQQAVTNSNGQVTLPANLADDSDTIMIIRKAGFSTLVTKCPCDNFIYALSPVMDNLDGLRVVLTWGANPSDLDAHLNFPNNHVFFSQQQQLDANLDVDDTTSYGPETITIEKKHEGKRYVYAVHDYTNGVNNTKNSKEMSFSDARVQVYVGQTLIRTYNVKPSAEGTSWVVFGIDENGAFHDINQYLSLNRDGVASHLNELIQASSFDNHSLITNAIKKEAKRINTRGEKIYHQGKLEDAMYVFQSAIDLYPSYGQAYSNLGLTYQKLNRTAEGLWANRKAIELAEGDKKDRVKASSYYNIARIYESKGLWQEALNNFRNAKALRSHKAYDKGIARMLEKL